jgi:hypothetical protein
VYIIYTETKTVDIDNQSQIAEQGVSYKSIVPGQNSEHDLNEVFGEELSTNEVGSRKIYEYKSTSPVRNHQTVTENEKVIFIKEIVTAKDSITSGSIKTEHGEPPFKLYDKNSPNSSFYLFTYPGKGLAFIGHEDGTLLEIWYFPPTSITEFIANWANDYSFKKPRLIQ